MVMLGTSLMRRRRAQARRVTFERGRSRAPYPPTTVSLWTNPSAPLRSASTTRMSRLRRLPGLRAAGGQAHAGGGLVAGRLRVLHGDLRAHVRGEVLDAHALGAVPDPRIAHPERPRGLRAGSAGKDATARRPCRPAPGMV